MVASSDEPPSLLGAESLVFIGDSQGLSKEQVFHGQFLLHGASVLIFFQAVCGKVKTIYNYLAASTLKIPLKAKRMDSKVAASGNFNILRATLWVLIMPNRG